MEQSRITWFCIILVFWGWLLADRLGEHTLPTMFLAYIPPLVWLLLAAMFVAWTLWSERYMTVALLMTLISLLGTGVLHWRLQSSGELRVMTYNVASGSRTSPEQLAQFFNSIKPHIILLQETKYTNPQFRLELQRLMSTYIVSHAGEVSTMSRLPMITAYQYPLPGMNREVLVTQLRWKNEKIHVVNAHLGAMQFGSVLKGKPYQLLQSRNARAKQIDLLVSIAKRTSGHLILGGDLNTPPRGVFYRRLTSYYGPSAHDTAGQGVGWTYPHLRLRIDHIMATHLKATKSKVLNVRYSDHRPLLAEYK